MESLGRLVVGAKQYSCTANCDLRLPFNHQKPNRHHIPKMKHLLTNRRDGQRRLLQCGEICFWNKDGANGA